MPTNITGRVTTIVVVTLVFLAGIFSPLLQSPSMLFDGSIPFLRKTNVRPGIDMVGGTSLLYEIKVPADRPSVYSGDLAGRMMEALKRRVDPEGVRNLIWRPQGGNRLEIQMPLSGAGTGGANAAEQKRKDLLAAREKLEATNVHRAEVIAAVEAPAGPDRQKLEQLAAGSPALTDLFNQLVETHQAVKKAHDARDAAAEAAALNRYDELKAKVEETNVTAEQMENVLPLVPGAPGTANLDAKKLEANNKARLQQFDALKARFAGFPRRLEALESYRKAHEEFNKIRAQIDDASDLKRLLQGAGVLEFHILAVPPGMGGKSNISDAEYMQWAQRLQKEGPRTKGGDLLKWFVVDDPQKFGREHLTVPYGGDHYVLSWITPEKSLDNREGRSRWKLEHAGKTTGKFNDYVVSFSFDPQGAQYFGELTGSNRDEPLAIVLDGRVISAPNINERIGGSGVIEGGQGGFKPDDLDYLVRTLAAGSLPAELSKDPIREQTVGPQLGADNLRRGLYACVFGLFVVAVFLIGYYYLAGVVATIAVLLNMVLILGAIAMLPGATITLPGIAGIVLTIGMAVDSNVLIFERLREEQVRGLSLRMALRNAYDRAWTAILDSNVTTAITAAVLYFFGSEEVKGFGLTLMIGIFASLFTALYVTKTLFAILIDKYGVTKLGSLPLTYPKWDQMLRPNIDWMGKAWAFYTFSAVFLTLGLFAFGWKLYQGQMLDIEFTKGTSVQFDLKQPLGIEQIRKDINDYSQKHSQELPGPNVVAVGGDKMTYEVVTPSDNAEVVRQAVIQAMGDKLKVQLPSRFVGVGSALDAAVAGGTVIPVESAEQKLAGAGNFVPSELSRHVGGVAIVLRDLDPPLKASQVEDRIEQERMKAGRERSNSSVAALRLNVVDVPPAEAGGKAAVVVLASSSEFSYDAKDEQKRAQWLDAVAGSMWQVVNDSVNRAASLQSVKNFDAQVANETMWDAIKALTISILAIMAYIWVRFGNLKYGTATVVALIHDGLCVLAAIGIAHYVSSTFLGQWLLIEPFRINLTMVAAVLTVMGYSMNDTVVVFDRIRENRGKFGHVSRQIVNDSINQTMSRTLLTGGTTIITIFVMYVFGGAGIHGFTFALLVGILVGTYSSIAIASPILLTGSGRPQEAGTPRGGRPVGQLQRA